MSSQVHPFPVAAALRGVEEPSVSLDLKARGEQLLVLANAVSLARLFLSGALVATYTVAGRSGLGIALGLVCIIWASDIADGFIARLGHRCGAAPRGDGQALDPLVDDVAYATGFLVLMGIGAVPLWFVVLAVVSRSLFALVRMVGLVQNRPFAGPLLATKAKGVAFAAGQIALFAAAAHPRGPLAAHEVNRAILATMTALCLAALLNFAAKTNGRVFRELLRPH